MLLKSALVDMCQFATRSNQLGGAKLLNEVEELHIRPVETL